MNGTFGGALDNSLFGTATITSAIKGGSYGETQTHIGSSSHCAHTLEHERWAARCDAGVHSLGAVQAVRPQLPGGIFSGSGNH